MPADTLIPPPAKITPTAMMPRLYPRTIKSDPIVAKESDIIIVVRRPKLSVMYENTMYAKNDPK